MSEVGAPGADAAPAAPADTSVPLPDRGPSPPNPASSTPAGNKDEVTQGQPPSGKERRSIEDSIKVAHDKASKEAAAKETAKAKPEPARKETPKVEPRKTPERERGEHGHFASTRQDAAEESDGEARAPHHDAPTRFSAEAKAEWQAVPDKVKAEVHRAQRELESGLYKYRQDAEAYNQHRDIFEYHKQTNGGDFKQWYGGIKQLEQGLVSDDPNTKAATIERLLKISGVTPQQYASFISGQPQQPQEVQQQQYEQELGALRQELATIKQGFQQDRQRSESEKIERVVTDYAQARPRFDELSLEIASYLNGQNDRGIHVDPQRRMSPDQRLQQAYDLAERLNPSTSSSAPLTPERSRNASKSIAGSPANGSDPSLPARKGKHSTIDESIRRAAARLGG